MTAKFRTNKYIRLYWMLLTSFVIYDFVAYMPNIQNDPIIYFIKIIFILIIVYCLPSIFKTRYTIDGGKILAHHAFKEDKILEINNIYKIKKLTYKCFFRYYKIFFSSGEVADTLFLENQKMFYSYLVDYLAANNYKLDYK